MEIMDLYDKNRQPLHRTAVRGTTLPDGEYRIVVHICLFDRKGNMLIQQRQSSKTIFPDLWDITAGGQVGCGEDSAHGAQRELLEELGISISMTHLRPAFTMNFQDGFDDVYLIIADIAPDTLALQQEEVKAVKLASHDEILDMIAQGTFIPYKKSYIDLLFDSHNESGSFENWSESGEIGTKS